MALSVYYALAVAFVTYRLYRVFHNLYLHPLAKVPGPKLYAASWIPRLWNQHVLGKHWRDLIGLHEKYGGIVRTGPDEVSNASEKSWEDIGGVTGRQFMRDFNFFRISQLQTEGKSFISQDRYEHHFIRRLLQPAFSNKAFLRHEDIVLEWTDKLCRNVEAHGGEAFDLERAFTWFTFDIMGVLSFGEPFGCLENNRNHPYLTAVTVGTPVLSVLQVILRYRATVSLYSLALKLPWARLWNSLREISNISSTKWLNDVADENRDDIMSTIYRGMKNEETPLTRIEADDVASILVLSGAESTPILMTAMIWNILRTPRVHDKIREEIRNSGVLRSSADITAANVEKLPYLDAILMETLRTDSPFAVAIPRIVPAGGANVDGYWLPGGTTCGVPHWSAGNWARNFADPQVFVPERWMPDERDTNPEFQKYANDKRGAFKPFAKGPLDCLGKRFVYHETRMVIATIIWNFDMELQPESLGWGFGRKVRIIRPKRRLAIKAWPRKVELLS